MTSVHNWSLKSEENASIDEIIDWREGQLPSSINDSARAMMTRIKEFVLERGAENIRITLERNIYNFLDMDDNDIKAGRLIRFRAPGTNLLENCYVRFGKKSLPLYRFSGGEIIWVKSKEIIKDHIHTLLIQSTDSKMVPYRAILLDPSIERSLSGMIALIHKSFFSDEHWLLCDGRRIKLDEYPSLRFSIADKTVDEIYTPRISPPTGAHDCVYAMKV